MTTTNLQVSWLCVAFMFLLCEQLEATRDVQNFKQLITSTDTDRLYKSIPLTKRAPARGRVLCGKQLSESIQVLCNGKYATEGERRRRNADWFFGKKFVDVFDKTMPDGFLQPNAESVVRKRMNEKQTGLYWECCLNQCSIKQMVSYCHPDVQRTRYSHLF